MDGTGFIWAIVVGACAGLAVKSVMPGDKERSGFVLAAIWGVLGAVLASYLGQAMGWFAGADGAAGLLGAALGALVVLLLWALAAPRA